MPIAQVRFAVVHSNLSTVGWNVCFPFPARYSSGRGGEAVTLSHIYDHHDARKSNYIYFTTYFPRSLILSRFRYLQAVAVWLAVPVCRATPPQLIVCALFFTIAARSAAATLFRAIVRVNVPTEQRPGRRESKTHRMADGAFPCLGLGTKHCCLTAKAFTPHSRSVVRDRAEQHDLLPAPVNRASLCLLTVHPVPWACYISQIHRCAPIAFDSS